ncbi:LptF/LptG family permease [Candidatus Omnitrophota bacterium]
MRIVDKYIVRSVIASFLGIISIFCFLYIIIDLFTNLEQIIEYNVSLRIIIEYYISFLPIIFIHTSPIACLLSTLFILAKLNSNNEIIALRSAGLNVWQITKSTIVFACIISAIIFWFNERIVPAAMATTNNIKIEHIEPYSEENKKDKINNLAFYGLENRLFFINSFNPKTNTIKGLTILKHDSRQNLRKKVFALEATWQDSKWHCNKCQVYYYDILDKEYVDYYEEKDLDFPETPTDLLRQHKQVSFMNIRQLQEYINKLTFSGAQSVIRNLTVEMQQKFAYPFSNLIIVLVGLPFALMTRRRKALTFTSLGIALGIVFIYYVINAVCVALGKAGVMPPLLAAWTSNIILLITALLLLRKIH